MITDRFLEDTDLIPLAENLAEDSHHFETPVSFFTQDRTFSKVYQDEQGPICVARVTKSLRLDIHFLDNEDESRNVQVLFQGIKPLVEQAREAEYTEIVFTTNVEKLKNFCVKVFGFEVVSDKYVLRLFL